MIFSRRYVVRRNGIQYDGRFSYLSTFNRHFVVSNMTRFRFRVQAEAALYDYLRDLRQWGTKHDPNDYEIVDLRPGGFFGGLFRSFGAK